MSLRMGSNQGGARTSFLDKRVPRNPRYANVKSKVSTGMTVDKLTFITTRQHLRRREEPFFRLTPPQLSELLSEYEQDQQEGVQDFRDHIDPDHHGPRVVEHEADDLPKYERPYLVLDVRPPGEYRLCHIMQARSFEAKLLNQDRMTPELYTYKNRAGGLVVLYSNDESDACHAARTLIHRGFDNVFVLSGGLVAFARGFSPFVEGDVTTLPSMPPSGGGGGSGSSVGGGGRSTAAASRDRRSKAGSGSASDGGSVGATGSSVHSGGRTVAPSGARLDYRGNSGGGRSVVVRGGLGNSSLRHGGGGGGGGIAPRGARGEARSGVGGAASTAVSRRGSARGGVGGGTACSGGQGSGAPLCALRGGEGEGRSWDRADLRGLTHGAGAGSCSIVSGGRGAPGGHGLGEAAVAAASASAASAARRRGGGAGQGVLDGGGRGGGGEGGDGHTSKGSAVSVADSVISRATARRGRW